MVGRDTIGPPMLDLVMMTCSPHVTQLGNESWTQWLSLHKGFNFIVVFGRPGWIIESFNFIEGPMVSLASRWAVGCSMARYKTYFPVLVVRFALIGYPSELYALKYMTMY